jgi:hypothetical protein
MSGGPPPLPLIAYPDWLKPAAAAGPSAFESGPASAAAAVPDQGFLRDVFDFLFGDVASVWTGGREGFPYGKWLAGAIRVMRGTGFVIKTLRGIEVAVPLFNNGFVGSKLIQGLGFIAPRASAWLAGPAGSLFFQRVGIVGGVVGTGLGIYNLWQQGNPADAYEKRGAGYVADVASTAFSATSAVFFAAPNPYTGAAMVLTGAVWLGAEAWDEYGDDIKEGLSSAADSAGDFLSSAADTVGGALDDAGSWVSSNLDDIGSGLEDAGAALVGKLGSIF